jgi:hypothetical protein
MHAQRVLHRGINIHTWALLLLITEEWVHETPQVFLTMIRSHRRSWHMVRIEDPGSPPIAAVSLDLASPLQSEGLFLPNATPELNAVDHL